VGGVGEWLVVLWGVAQFVMWLPLIWSHGLWCGCLCWVCLWDCSWVKEVGQVDFVVNLNFVVNQCDEGR
jgi:hypothetical protein